jgi:hypothetical protein
MHRYTDYSVIANVYSDSLLKAKASYSDSSLQAKAYSDPSLQAKANPDDSLRAKANTDDSLRAKQNIQSRSTNELIYQVDNQPYAQSNL